MVFEMLKLEFYVPSTLGNMQDAENFNPDELYVNEDALVKDFRANKAFV